MIYLSLSSAKLRKILISAFILVFLGTLVFSYASSSYAEHYILDKGLEPVAEPYRPGDTARILVNIPDASEAIAENNADIALVMDRTGSMNEDFGGGLAGIKKMDAAKTAMKTFLDNTQENFDYVGLVSYNTRSELNYPISNMNVVNKADLAIEIDDLVPTGATSIGKGVLLAGPELVKARRVGAGQYMVLATDGRQNTDPSPFEDKTIIDPLTGLAISISGVQYAIDNNIKIYTVGIGEDAVTEGIDIDDSDCKGCPDLDGDGEATGEEVMKVIACDTDPDCSPGNPGNNPNNPKNYFFADDADKLNDIYELIAGLIDEDSALIVDEVINSSVFGKDIDVDSVHVSDKPCSDGWDAGSEVTPIYGPVVDDYSVTIVLPPIPKDEANCLSFEAIIKVEVEPGEDLEIDDKDEAIIYAFPPGTAACTDLVDDPNEANLDICRSAVFGTGTPIPVGKIKVESPFFSWVQTKGGTVGVIEEIKMKRDGLPSGEYNAGYSVISTDSDAIEKFTSAKKWLLNDYPDFNPESLERSDDIYATLFEKYRNIKAIDLSNPGDIFSKITGGIMVSEPAGGEVKFEDLGKYSTDKPSIVFIDGELIINKNVVIDIAINKGGLIFIVNGDINVNSSVGRLDGIYISTGEFTTGSSDTQLNVNGSVISFEDPKLERDLGPGNKAAPAELIDYQPAYLWIFKDVAGFSTKQFKELTP